MQMFAAALAVCALFLKPAFVRAEVNFDGKRWYVSKDPESLRINEDGYLEWSAPGPEQQLFVRLDDKALSDVGDAAEVMFLYKVEGPPSSALFANRGARKEPDCRGGSFRIGMFDSNKQGYVEEDGYGYKNDLWDGYLGYYAQVHPHLPGDTRGVSGTGEVQLPGKMMQRLEGDGEVLLPDPAGHRNVNAGISGFSAPVGKFVPVIIRLKKTNKDTIHYHLAIDEINYFRIHEHTEIAEQIHKIDVLSIFFPEEWPYSTITIAPMSERKSAMDSGLRPASMHHVDVYKEPGRFGGWPAGYSANQWIWGNEIMVAFLRGYYKHSPTSHNADWSRPSDRCQARSLDGGESWTLEETVKTTEKPGWPDPNNGGINFTHPDFAMKLGGGGFSISYDRGRTWKGSYPFKGIDLSMTSRHAYMVEGKKKCLFWLSAAMPRVTGSNHSDRSFMARTTDGGKSFEFVSWLTDEKSIKIRSVMPSGARLSPSRLVATTRRKVRDPYSRKYYNWIEASVSTDNGSSWRYLSKVANTDRGEENGSPPAMVRLEDGRLAITYGYRSYPYGIRAKISEDGGKSWSEEIILRDNGGTWDLGYPRMMQRPDGKLVSIYYFNTKEHPGSFIEATIWDPDTVR